MITDESDLDKLRGLTILSGEILDEAVDAVEAGSFVVATGLLQKHIDFLDETLDTILVEREEPGELRILFSSLVTLRSLLPDVISRFHRLDINGGVKRLRMIQPKARLAAKLVSERRDIRRIDE